jgi:hypothetical protein
MNKKLRLLLIVICVIFFNFKVNAQSITYTFVDPCTQNVSYFSIPLQGTTTIVFLNQQRTFTADDVASGVFANWINQVYSDYRITVPCSVQSTNVVRNLISTQILSNTIGNLIGSITSQVGSETSSNDAASKGKTESDKKKKTDNKTSNTNNSTTSNTNNSTENNQNSQSGEQSNQNSPVVSENSQSQGQSTSNDQSSNPQSKNTSDNQSDGGEINGTMAMNVDSKNEKGGSSSKSSGNGNPIIISSDYTNAQNLDKSFTGIINIGMSQSSLTGKSSYGLTSMTWFNFKQFALSGRYTSIHFSKNGKLKLIHNLNLTGLYTYGNYMGFFGYSVILNAGKWGITGANVSVSTTKITEDKNTFISPAITAFYTRPTKVNNKLILSPELYVISTPLVYSSAEKTTVSDRTFSAFIGTGIDYQITQKFKVNINYKVNMSTNPDFPILNFFLIGSKINL